MDAARCPHFVRAGRALVASAPLFAFVACGTSNDAPSPPADRPSQEGAEAGGGADGGGGVTPVRDGGLDASNSDATRVPEASSAVDGACGSANSVPVLNAPDSNLCLTGDASAVSGSGPWTWTCSGSGGGTTANCSAPKTIVPGTTRNVACTGDITTAVKNAIDASSDGDLVNIGAGTCSMGNLGTISDKNITIQGAGKDATIITADSGFGQMVSNGSNSPNWRLSGFTLTSTVAGVVPVYVWANAHPSWRGPFRIDHVSFHYPNGGAAVYVFGPTYGLIDHDDFYGAYESQILTGLIVDTECGSATGIPCTTSNLAGSYAASLAYRPGGATNLYIEDNTFTGSSPNGMAATDTGYTGARVVFRHNTLLNATMYSHWTSGGNVNSLWWEIYGNKFTWTLGQSMYPFRLQGGGTGLIYDNTISGFPSNFILLGDGRLPDQNQSGAPLLLCDGTHDWDGNAGDSTAPGWPCLAQTGRNAGKSIAQILAGDKPGSFPLYVWNNGPQDTCSNPAAAGPACDNSFGVNTYSTSAAKYFKATPHATPGFGNGDVDYSITASKPAGAGTHVLNYTPFTYPYPLNAYGMPDPGAK